MAKKSMSRIDTQYSAFSGIQTDINSDAMQEFTSTNLGDFSTYIGTQETPCTIECSYTIKFVDKWQGQGTEDSPHPVMHSVTRSLKFLIVNSIQEYETKCIDLTDVDLVVDKKLQNVLQPSRGIDHQIWAFFNRIEITNVR